jgi:hypothetical protein
MNLNTWRSWGIGEWRLSHLLLEIRMDIHKSKVPSNIQLGIYLEYFKYVLHLCTNCHTIAHTTRVWGCVCTCISLHKVCNSFLIVILKYAHPEECRWNSCMASAIEPDLGLARSLLGQVCCCASKEIYIYIVESAQWLSIKYHHIGQSYSWPAIQSLWIFFSDPLKTSAYTQVKILVAHYSKPYLPNYSQQPAKHCGYSVMLSIDYTSSKSYFTGHYTVVSEPSLIMSWCCHGFEQLNAWWLCPSWRFKLQTKLPLQNQEFLI